MKGDSNVIIKEIQDINIIIPLHKEIFGKDFPIESYYKKSKSNKLYIFVYEEDLNLFGYSIVVDQENEKNLYAWYGGVLPKFQGNGITQIFFKKLIEFAKNNEYLSITLASSNLRPHMLRLAIKMGFDIYDLKKRTYGEGNKIYFKYNILPPHDETIYLKNFKPVEIESKLVEAYKSNCVLLKIKYEEKDWEKLIYTIQYCNSFFNKPQIIINTKIDIEFDEIIGEYQGEIIIVKKLQK